MAGEEKRHQMMQNLFGDQSEEEEEEVESEHESNRQPDYASDEGGGAPEPEDEEGEGEVAIQNDVEPQDLDHTHEESEGERDHSPQEVEIGDQREESEDRYLESDEEEHGQRVVTSRRHDAFISESEGSGENHFAANEDDEVNHARSHRK
ncbi:hypothetical protein CASFOL_001066 [Castilleja foliolosa]|uniref:Uncharacterized protein n=1 Tax=Castilleja foliolosa TaxID=1961234 RepID=A0ABD3EM12_9LAMI